MGPFLVRFSCASEGRTINLTHFLTGAKLCLHRISGRRNTIPTATCENSAPFICSVFAYTGNVMEIRGIIYIHSLFGPQAISGKINVTDYSLSITISLALKEK